MKWKKGTSMFELLVVVFVIGITLTAVLGLVSNTLGNTTFARERTQAAKHTQDAVEWLRGERDRDWGAFVARGSAGGTCYSLSSLSWTNGGCPPGGVITGTTFRRSVTLFYPSSGNSNVIEVRVAITWQDASGTHESRVTTFFSNWRTR